MQGLLNLPFSSLIRRGSFYDIAELARIMAHSVPSYLLNQVLEKKDVTCILMRRMNGSCTSMLIHDNEITISDQIKIGIDDIRRYSEKLVVNIKDLAQVFSSSFNYKNDTIVIELHGYKDTIYRLLDRELVYVIYNICNISRINSIEYALTLRTTSLKGILRYALLKLTITYSLYYLIKRNREINIKDILRVLALYAYIITYSNYSFVFPSENVIHLRRVLKRDIVILSSVIFGAGTNKSIVSVEYVNKDFSNTAKYVIRMQENAIYSKIIFERILNKFKKNNSCRSNISIKKLLYGLFCLIIGSLNYVRYLDEPLIPIIPRRLGKESINRLVVLCRLPNISSYYEIKDIIEAADDFLKFYVEEHILKSLEY